MTGTTSTANKNFSDKSTSDDDSSSLSLGFSDDDDSSTDQRKRTTTSKIEQRPKKFFKTTTTTTPRKPSRKKNTIQKKMMVLEQKKQARLRKLKLREQAMNASDNECDSDEELGLKDSPKEKTNIGSAVKTMETKAIDLLSSGSDSSPDSSPVKANPTEANNPIELSDDDDSDDSDDDIDYSKIQVQYDEKTKALMRGAGDATANLIASNHYHADDVHVEVNEDQFLQLRTPTIRRTVPRPKPKINYGKPIQVKCHCGHFMIAGQRVAVEKEKQSITLLVKEKEPLSALAERFCKAHSLPYDQSTITLNFDGDKLELTKTPLQCEIDDDGYIVDFTASAPTRCT